MTIAELEAIAADRGISLDEVTDAIRQLPAQVNSTLTDAEQAVLRQLGLDPSDRSNAPILAGILRRTQLEQEALTEGEAAWVLGSDVANIRQRVTGRRRTLLAFRSRSAGGPWLLPTFQFELGLHDVHEWGSLLQALPPSDDTSPTALANWLTVPQAQLDRRSRAQALAEGIDVDRLLADASSFGIPP